MGGALHSLKHLRTNTAKILLMTISSQADEGPDFITGENRSLFRVKHKQMPLPNLVVAIRSHSFVKCQLTFSYVNISPN